jgi:hypothetical protein
VESGVFSLKIDHIFDHFFELGTEGSEVTVGRWTCNWYEISEKIVVQSQISARDLTAHRQYERKNVTVGDYIGNNGSHDLPVATTASLSHEICDPTIKRLDIRAQCRVEANGIQTLAPLVVERVAQREPNGKNRRIRGCLDRMSKG